MHGSRHVALLQTILHHIYCTMSSRTIYFAMKCAPNVQVTICLPIPRHSRAHALRHYSNVNDGSVAEQWITDLG